MQHINEQVSWREREHLRRENSSNIRNEIVHLARNAGIFAPLLIAEFVKDSEKKWHFVKVTSITAGAISMALSPHRSHADYERERRSISGNTASLLA